jgi:endogenous inhibitor of DNA gyrase (YacG/DUF329 family)
MRRKIICPRCRRETTWMENPYRPFCSERCKLIDLGSWITEGYVIPERRDDQPSDHEELEA